MPEAAFLFIHALTGLHPGSGTALGVVDLPVQREKHTSWPTVQASSLKGVLRSETSRQATDDTQSVFAAFGPETNAAQDHAGALSFSDARILAFPVRSLTGVFAWVTCPAVLGRLARDLGTVGSSLPSFPQPKRDMIACCADSPLLANETQVMLEEFDFTRDGDADAVVDWIASNAVGDAGTADRLRTHLAVLNDDNFTHFVRNATDVVARIGLDYDLKTVRGKALFYEEHLPPETLFYSLVTSSDSRRSSHALKAREMLDWLQKNTPDVLQIGGGETIGKGFCAVRYFQPAPRTEQ